MNPNQICNCHLSLKGLKITEIADNTLKFSPERVIEWARWITEVQNKDRGKNEQKLPQR